MDSEEKDIDLGEIISNSMNKTRENSPEAYDYFVSLSGERLVRRLTPSQAKEIARELLIKIGLVNSK
jgi:hypothetical protein